MAGCLNAAAANLVGGVLGGAERERNNLVYIYLRMDRPLVYLAGQGNEPGCPGPLTLSVHIRVGTDVEKSATVKVDVGIGVCVFSKLRAAGLVFRVVQWLEHET